MGPDFFVVFRQKNNHSSKSVCSFDAGPFFCHSLGQELSMNVFVVSVYAFEKKFDRRKAFLVTPKSRDFHEFLTFLENS